MKIDPAAVTAAQTEITAIGDDFAAAAKFPDASFTRAPAVSAAMGSAGSSFATRIENDVALVDAIASAMGAVLRVLQRVDADLADQVANGIVVEEGD